MLRGMANGTVAVAGFLVLAMAGAAAGTSQLDLDDGGLIVDYDPAQASPLLTLVGYVQGGQISSSAILDPFAQAIGVVQNNTWQFAPPMASFMGVALPGDGTEVLARYTYAGDTDLNGVVDGNDYFNIDWGFLNGLTGFNNGDLDYNGAIDGNDYFLMDWSFLFQGAPLTSGSVVNLPTPVNFLIPEPVTAALGLGLGAIGLYLRRRRAV